MYIYMKHALTLSLIPATDSDDHVRRHVPIHRRARGGGHTAVVERAVGVVGYVRVHAVLLVQQRHGAGGPLLGARRQAREQALAEAVLLGALAVKWL